MIVLTPSFSCIFVYHLSEKICGVCTTDLCMFKQFLDLCYFNHQIFFFKLLPIQIDNRIGYISQIHGVKVFLIIPVVVSSSLRVQVNQSIHIIHMVLEVLPRANRLVR